MKLLNKTQRLIMAGEIKFIPTMIGEIEDKVYKTYPTLAELVTAGELEIVTEAEDLIGDTKTDKK